MRCLFCGSGDVKEGLWSGEHWRCGCCEIGCRMSGVGVRRYGFSGRWTDVIDGCMMVVDLEVL